MTELYARILLWHKLIAMQTGGLALCSAKRRLNRDEATGWVAALRNVADDISQFLQDGTFILDSRGQRVVGCGGGETTGPKPSTVRKEERHVEQTNIPEPQRAASLNKAGGPRRIARRKTWTGIHK